MKKTKGIIFIALILLVCWSQILVAGSIWAKRNKNMKDIYSDDVAHRIGDILTIEIIEKSTVDNKAKRDLEKSDTRNTTFNGEIGQ
ncbi:MAG: flagellar basal body L-ring protein FlgH, partial [Planctomycetes bacterium]|nr:flagellar basal body L-ring protein FlgH [Planctomycetota bacterium]